MSQVVIENLVIHSPFAERPATFASATRASPMSWWTAVERQVRTGKLTREQAAEIKKRVELIALEMSKYDRGKSHFQEVYGALREKADVTSYKYIPPVDFEATTAFLGTWFETLREARPAKSE